MSLQRSSTIASFESNALAYIGRHGLDLVWSAFFDDYTVLCCEQEDVNVTFYVESLFRLLGIGYAVEGDKAPPFQPVFKSLGLEFSLGSLQHGYFLLQHTESRRELVSAIDVLLNAQRITAKELERLHGRLVWFNSFVFGRLMNHAVKIISINCHSNSKYVACGTELKNALDQLRKTLLSCKPLEISKSLCKTWIVFTDGAFEPTAHHRATLGGVLVSPNGTVPGVTI